MSHTPTLVADFTPVSLLDFPGEIATTVFTHGCNLRCRYCHNPALVLGQPGRSRQDQLLEYIDRHQIGAVAITGGEPLFQRELETLLQQLRSRKIRIKLDTNGTLPHRLKQVLEQELVDFVAVDVKAFNDADMAHITRTCTSIQPLLTSLAHLCSASIPFELRHTLWKLPEPEELRALAAHCGSAPLALQFLRDRAPMLDKRFRSPLSATDFTTAHQRFAQMFSRVITRGENTEATK
ncbi:anaerobic ribonucleoside-triphosphate reductase activating protein [Desulfurispirillum indicum]|uniref:Anaerobic ribonucleoside-triphosphate reductase activating protein n=1 Tax=Desulfurispirillum indicum (strain ATCC BAA-1389 / DSM 22839 / S5) TaxID=653733 RepID=E6W443_DESIS|nr:anaerobic ribonucleoside-triphosphate reductase activating protein [Desulfurispirillum indicum]ADU67007.1 anaerobic ribonucleoside-triphosphate reductase activating protein [Desulfurispirillum indicum S5]UCZ56240.1 anaerobic ribonucleoside-triphosphate reductase activating protein [Desulfurispirillum indicum]